MRRLPLFRSRIAMQALSCVALQSVVALICVATKESEKGGQWMARMLGTDSTDSYVSSSFCHH